MKKGMMIKDFREKVLEKRKDISDKEILLSEQCHVYLENLIEAVTKRYNQKIRLRIVWTDDDWIAFATDKYEVQINMNNHLVLNAGDCLYKTVIAKGLSIHECGHLLFTDYHLLKSAFKVFQENRKLFPEPKCSAYTEWMTDAVAMNKTDIIQWMQVYKRLENHIEDGFIEYKLLDILPGEGQCLYALRKTQLADFQSVKAMKADGLSSPAILFNCILMLAKYNTVLMDADDAKEPAVAALFDNYNLIKQAVHTEKSYDRVKLINEIFCNLYHFLKEDSQNKKESEPDKSNKPDDSSDTKSQNDKQSGTSNEANQTDKQNSSSNTGNQTDKQNNSSNTENKPQEQESSMSSNVQNEQKSDSCSPSALLENSPNGMNEQVDTGSGSVLNDKNISQNPVSMAKNQQEKLNSILEGTKQEETAQIPSPQDKLLIEDIKDRIAEQEVMKSEENKLADTLQEEAVKFDFSRINKNIPISIIRKDPSATSYDFYDKAMREAGFLVKKTVNELKNKIKDQREGGKLNSLYNGRYLDRSNLYRYDMRIMCKNELPEDIPDMAVSILLDESGSMKNDNKSWYAVLTALIIYLVCKELNIPVMVYSHNASGAGVKITALADFNSVDGKDKYRICDFTPFWGNRDGMALRFCSERLANRPEHHKFQMIISDGLPSYYSSQEEAMLDIKKVLMDYSKRDVKYIAYGLGNEQERIENIYVQNLSPKTAARFIKTNAPEELPKLFVKTIKYLLKV